MVREGYVDHTQFDPDSKYYDPKSTKDKPKWMMVDIHFKRKFVKTLLLKEIKAMPEISEIGLVKKVIDCQFCQLIRMDLRGYLANVNGYIL